MADIVPADRIEHLVGVPRHKTRHYARVVSDEHTVYILHSRDCLGRYGHHGLTVCEYSIALDFGIDDLPVWDRLVDVPVVVVVEEGRLVPDRAAAWGGRHG